jgi:hypothetical protein
MDGQITRIYIDHRAVMISPVDSAGGYLRKLAPTSASH